MLIILLRQTDKDIRYYEKNLATAFGQPGVRRFSTTVYLSNVVCTGGLACFPCFFAGKLPFRYSSFLSSSSMTDLFELQADAVIAKATEHKAVKIRRLI